MFKSNFNQFRRPDSAQNLTSAPQSISVVRLCEQQISKFVNVAKNRISKSTFFICGYAVFKRMRLEGHGRAHCKCK
jgi:hypothetical protein